MWEAYKEHYLPPEKSPTNQPSNQPTMQPTISDWSLWTLLTYFLKDI